MNLVSLHGHVFLAEKLLHAEIFEINQIVCGRDAIELRDAVMNMVLAYFSALESAGNLNSELQRLGLKNTPAFHELKYKIDLILDLGEKALVKESIEFPIAA